MGRRESTGKVEIFLSGPELAYFDDLKGEMSRAALARILISFALKRADEAFAHHAQTVKHKHGIHTNGDGDGG